jgi:hypothetical protein
MASKHYNYNFDPGVPYSKEDIQRFTGLSKNTVSKTLEEAGLSTSERMYLGQYLLDYFVPVRRLLDSGMGYEKIRKMRKMNEASAPDDKTQYGQSVDEDMGLNSLDQAIGEGLAETVYSSVELAVEDLIESIPQMAGIALSKAASEGKITAAFKKSLREYFATRRSIPYDLSGAQQEGLPAIESVEATDEPKDSATMWFEESLTTDQGDLGDGNGSDSEQTDPEEE